MRDLITICEGLRLPGNLFSIHRYPRDDAPAMSHVDGFEGRDAETLRAVAEQVAADGDPTFTGKWLAFQIDDYWFKCRRVEHESAREREDYDSDEEYEADVEEDSEAIDIERLDGPPEDIEIVDWELGI